MEDWFSSVDQTVKHFAFVVLGALFVDGEVDVIQHGSGNVTAIFETGAHTVGGRRCGQEFDVINGVFLCHAEAICVFICVNVVLHVHQCLSRLFPRRREKWGKETYWINGIATF